MNKPFFYTAAAIILLTAASRNAFCQAVMTMTTAPKTEKVKIGLAGSGNITIDWGDGKSENYTFSSDYLWIEHTYSDGSAHTITIIGKNIKEMDCSSNNLISLDVSKYTKLKILHCINNKLTNLDISKNKKIINLGCAHNNLTNLDVSKNTKLILLLCSFNQLTNLDVSKNRALKILWVSNNQLTSLDVNKNRALEALSCANNHFSEAALNALFKTLHNTIFKEDKVIYLYGNPGTDSFNYRLDGKKGWIVEE